MIPAALEADAIDVGYGDGLVLRDLSLRIDEGRVTSIIGPNGCGKSTLLRTLARLLRPARGEVRVNGLPTRDLRPRQLARRLTLLPQSPVAPEGLSVADLVARGRHPHQPWYRQWSAEDEQIVAEDMAATGVADLADVPLEHLSGGQRQRAWIAMALAQRTPLILLDEPTTHLDLAHAVEVLELVVRLRAEHGRTIVMVLHDLALAGRYSDHLVLVRDGRLVTQGAPGEVLTESILAENFGLLARVHPDPVDGLPAITPVSHR